MFRGRTPLVVLVDAGRVDREGVDDESVELLVEEDLGMPPSVLASVADEVRLRFAELAAGRT
jgi:hypothetical protein